MNGNLSLSLRQIAKPKDLCHPFCYRLMSKNKNSRRSNDGVDDNVTLPYMGSYILIGGYILDLVLFLVVYIGDGINFLMSSPIPIF